MSANKLPDNRGYFGLFGGRFVPETLVPAFHELEAAYDRAKAAGEIVPGAMKFRPRRTR